MIAHPLVDSSTTLIMGPGPCAPQGGLDDKLNDALAKNEPDSGARPLIEAVQHEKHCGTAEQRLGAIGRLRGYIADWNRNAQHGEVMQR